MDHYIDLRLRPDPEFPEPLLLSALFSKLHRALVSLGANDVGISFPAHKTRPRTLGPLLRVHGSAARLSGLMELAWLNGMHNHLYPLAVERVPSAARHRTVHRVQPKTNVERLRRRHMRRHGVSEEVARERLPEDVVRPVALPHLSLRSRSTGETFCLFVEHGPIGDAPSSGYFSSYGLSRTATVPWF